MKSILKTSIAVVLVAAITLTGCGSSKKASKDVVVAEVNGEKIYKSKVIAQYNNQKSQYGITTENENSDQYKDTVKSLKSSVLESLIYQNLIMQNASKSGLKVTDALLAEAKTQFEDIKKSVEEQFKSQDQGNTSTTTDYTKKAQEYINEQLKQMGVTEEEFIRSVAEQKILDQFMDKSIGEVQVADTDIREFYDNELKAQKEGNATSDIQLFSLPGVMVKHILIALPEEEKTEAQNLYSQGKTEELNKYLEEKLKNIYPKAQEVLAKVKKGENFDNLITEYGGDPGMASNPEGYLVQKNGQMYPSFEEASLKLKKGQTTELVPSIFGYHIIKALDNVAQKTYTFEEVKEQIKASLVAAKEEEKWSSIIEGWMKEAKVVKYEEKL